MSSRAAARSCMCWRLSQYSGGVPKYLPNRSAVAAVIPWRPLMMEVILLWGRPVSSGEPVLGDGQIAERFLERLAGMRVVK